jgi:autotransporter-associated beta strand protein
MDFHKRTGTGFLFAPTGAALLLCALMSAMSAAAGTTWDGGGANASWGTANIWNPNGLPLFNGMEQITIGTGFASGTTMTLAGNRSNNDLSINATTGFTIAAGTGGTLNLRSANIILGAESGSLTFGGGTLQVTQDVTSLLAIKINTAGAGHTALFNVGVGKILQDASVLGKNGDPLLFNSGTSILSGSGSNETGSTNISGILSLPETVTPGPGNFAFAGGILELGNSNFTRALGTGVRQVNMNSASSGADFAAFGADRVANLGNGGATVTWGAGNEALSSSSMTGTGTGLLTSSTYAIQSDIGSPILAGPGSTMTKTPVEPDAVTAIKTWNGGGGSNNWSSSNNWGGTGAPAAGDSLFFGGSTRLAPNNDLTANTSFAGITFNAAAGAFTLGGNSITLGGNVTNNSAATETINNAITLGIAQTWSATSGNLVFGGAIANGGFLLTIGGNSNTTVSGIISGTGGLTKNGTGTLTFTGAAANTFTGTTTVNAGTLVLARPAGQNSIVGALVIGDGVGVDTVRIDVGDQFGTGLITINSSGVFQLNNVSEIIAALTMNGGAVTTGTGTLTLGGDVIGNVAATSATISGNLALSEFAGTIRTFTIADGAAAADMDISAVVSGADDLTKAGAGTMVLSGANTYTGVTTVSGGVLNIQNNTGLGTTAGGTTVSNGATLQFQNNVTIGNEALNIRGTGAAGQTGALVNVSGTNNYGGLLTLAGATTISSNSGTLNLTNTNTITGATFGLTLAGAGNGSIASVIGTTSGSLTKNGTGTWTLSGANTFTGATTVNGGTLVLASGSGSALGNTSGVTVNSGGTLFLGANNQINNTAAITLNGGTFARGDFSEGGINAAGVGALNLTAAGSHLDFGTGTVGILTFASFAPGANTLTIDNWTGTFSTQGTGLTDRLIFASDQSGNLGSFNFTGFGPGAVEFNLGNGYFEVVPVPEAGTYFSGSIVLALILLHHRKQLRQLVHRWRVSRKLRFSGAHGTGVAS